MKTRKTNSRRSRRAGRAIGVSRIRAAVIARARLIRETLSCHVSDKPPNNVGYLARPLPKNCWYVLCGPNYRHLLDGPAKTLLCISKRTGRVLLTTLCRSGG